MKQKLFILMIVLTTIAMVLTSCKSTATTAPAPAAPATSAPQAQATINLTVWHMEQPAYRVQRYQELIDAFNAANPGIVVKQEVQDWGTIYQKAPAAVAAGNAPDMLFTIPDLTPVLKDLNAVQPVEDLVNELNAKYQIYPSVISPYSYEGHIWALPVYNVVHNLWYRKDILSKAGVTPPTTYDELLAAAQKLTTGGQYGIGLPANHNLFTDQTTYDIMINQGAEEIYNTDGTLNFNNPKTVAAFDFYKQLYQYSPPDSSNWAWGEAEACLVSGTCAMILQFAVITSFDKAGGNPADLGVSAIPAAAGVTSGTVAYPCGVMVLTSDPAKKDASYKFLRFLFEPKNYGPFVTAEAGLYLPVTQDTAQNAGFWSDPLITKYNSQLQVMVKNSENGMLFGFLPGNVQTSVAKISSQNILSSALQKMLLEKMSAADAVAWGQAQMEAAIK